MQMGSKEELEILTIFFFILPPVRPCYSMLQFSFSFSFSSKEKDSSRGEKFRRKFRANSLVDSNSEFQN